MAEPKVKKFTIQSALNHIQVHLNAPKGQFNKFGKYAYRSAEDILEGLKPLLAETGCALIISDGMEEVGGRIYVKATATLHLEENSLSNSAFAREDETVKGMSVSQITGSASSYARKYAMNGLFAIDDTRDPDATDKHGKSEAPSNKSPDKKQESDKDDDGWS